MRHLLDYLVSCAFRCDAIAHSACLVVSWLRSHTMALWYDSMPRCTAKKLTAMLPLSFKPKFLHALLLPAALHVVYMAHLPGISYDGIIWT